MHQGGKGAAVGARGFFAERREDFQWQAFGGDFAGKTLRIGENPGRRVFGEGILPAAEPERDEANILLARDVDPVVEDGEIEAAFFGFDLVPSDWHEHGVEVEVRESGQDVVGLGCGQGGGVAEFASEHEERFALQNELLCGAYGVNCGEVLRGQRLRCRRKKNQSEQGGHHTQIHHGLHRRSSRRITRFIARRARAEPSCRWRDSQRGRGAGGRRCRRRAAYGRVAADRARPDRSRGPHRSGRGRESSR